MKREIQIHPLEPIFDENSRILILGTFPSVKSRETKFYYGHPRNRFWKVISTLVGEAIPTTIEEKTTLLLRHGIALWDVLSSCEIKGSSDSSISNPKPNDIGAIIQKTQLRQIFTNGKKAQQLYEKFIAPQINMEAHCLPSTSPANGRFHLEELLSAWKVIATYLVETKRVV